MSHTPAAPPAPGRTGADALAGALLRHAGRPTVFLVTGNQNLPLVDALGRRDVRLVHALVAQGYGAHGGEATDAAQFERQPAAALTAAGVSCLSVPIQRAASPAS